MGVVTSQYLNGAVSLNIEYEDATGIPQRIFTTGLNNNDIGMTIELPEVPLTFSTENDIDHTFTNQQKNRMRTVSFIPPRSVPQMKVSVG